MQASVVRPEIPLSDLEDISGRVVEIERAHPVAPRDLAVRRHTTFVEVCLPLLVGTRRRREAGVDLPVRAMGRWGGLVFGFVAVEHEEDVALRTDPVGEVEPELLETHHVPIETPYRGHVRRVAIEDRLKDAIQLGSLSHGRQ